MKRFSYVFALALLVSSFALPVFAENDTATSDKPSRGLFAPIRDAEAVREKMEERRSLFEEKRERVTDLLRERAGTFIERMVNVFTAAVERLQNIHDRMLARIEKIEDVRDIDLSEAKTYLSDAQTHIDEASELLASILAESDSFDEDDTNDKEEVASVRALFVETKEHIREAHTALRAAMQSVREALANDASDEDAAE